jgi:predicted RecB family nuclease
MRQHNGRLTYSPSDLNAFLACPHLTSLELAVGRGQLERPFRPNPYADLIRRKGDEHEAGYLASLGGGVAVIGDPREIGWDQVAAATEQAIRDQAPFVYQAALLDQDWHGLADFLEFRPDGSYEVIDTKLARRAKPAHLLQLCFYTEQVARIQGRWPEKMHVVNGLGERESFRPGDFLAYYRRLRARFLDAVENERPTYPYPVDHCSLCEFLARCEEQWERDDHLSLVAGIRRTQVERLNSTGIGTLEGLATTTETKIPKLRAETLAKLRDQAALQLHRRHTGELKHVLLPLQAERGFALLPEPGPGDIWLDFEGDPWYEPARGLEYLTGWVYLDDDGKPQYDCIWSLDRDQERAGFERLIDLIRERRARHPGMHVYHYAPYERTALQRLMGEHGTRENELDDLLRGEVLVDLFRVVRQALRLSLPSYSIKEVEAFYGFERDEEMRGGGSAVVAFEEWLEAREDAILQDIRAYNEDDCRSLFELHRWLLELRPAELEWRGPPEEREVKEETKERLEERARLEAELLEDAQEGEPRWLLAQLLEYHRREEKPQWWAYFNNLQLDPEELFESTECIGGLELAADPVPVKKSLEYTLRFPPQEHKIGAAAVDPATERRYPVKVDEERGCVTLRRSVELEEESLPAALIPPPPIRTSVQRDAVLRFAQAQDEYPALVEILEWRPPPAELRGVSGGIGGKPRRQLPVRAGPAGFGEDVARGARGDRADAARAAGRGHLAEPQGDPQVPGRCPGSGARGWVRVQGPQEVERRRGDRVRGRVRRLHVGQRGDVRRGAAAAGRDLVPVLARGDGPARRHAVRGRGGSGCACRRAGGRDGGAERRAAGRPKPAGAGFAGLAPARSRGLGAASSARLR